MKKEEVFTVQDAKKKLGLHFTLNHSGKMKGMQSLSTSCLLNEYCQTRSKQKNTICSHCYAQTQMKMYKQMEPCFAQNTEILTKRILNNDELPLINAAYFRFEAFGDINNQIQIINYFNMCKKNKGVKFALWTKNPWIIEKAIEAGYKKPSNLQIVYSSVYLNEPNNRIFILYPFIDKVFTVYDQKYIKENDVDINCGAKSCLACHKCYVKSKEKYINEQLK